MSGNATREQTKRGLCLEVRALRHVVPDKTLPGRERRLLDIPALRVEAGGSLAVTGPSGGGKTTLLHVLAGLLPPRAALSGEASRPCVRWGDTDIYALGEGRRDALRAETASMVFQDFQLIGGLSALENVVLPSFFRRFRVTEAERQAARELLCELGVTSCGVRVERLSRGEQQRVALARAFHRHGTEEGGCRVLFADEPTASLDAANAGHIAGLLCECSARRGLTLVCVTHDPRLAERMGQRLCLEDGKVKGVPTELATELAGKVAGEATTGGGAKQPRKARQA